MTLALQGYAIVITAASAESTGISRETRLRIGLMKDGPGRSRGRGRLN
jgi:hypothetical protein